MEKLNNIFIYIAAFLKNIFAIWNINIIFSDILMALVYFIGVVIFIVINVFILVWMERRVSAFFQERLGPNRIGPYGLLQTINDTVKLVGKESIIPCAADKWVFKLAPMFIFVTAIMLYAVIPYGKGMIVTNINVGIFYFIAVSSTTTIAILMAGWGSNNKYSLLGGMRTVAQIISYEIPIALSMLGVIMLTGSLNFSAIIAAQKNIWFIVLQPIAFIIFFISAIAELNRAPFDLPEAEQELIAGYHVEYSGIRFAFFFLAEYANMLSVSALAATLFLGGWHGPFLPSWLWMIIKIYFMIFLFMWIRWTYPRIRMEAMMKLSWKFLLPLALINVLLTGAGIKIFQYYHMMRG